MTHPISINTFLLQSHGKLINVKFKIERSNAQLYFRNSRPILSKLKILSRLVKIKCEISRVIEESCVKDIYQLFP